MRKEYAIKGIVERFVSVPLGKGTITFHFEGGALDSALSRPAIFSTTNPVEQAIIESLPEFKKGVITLFRTYGEKVKSNENTRDANTFPDVTNIQSARAVLNEMGVPIEALQTKAAVIKQAEEKGVKFPNWK